MKPIVWAFFLLAVCWAGVRADTCHGLSCFEDADDLVGVTCKFYHRQAVNIYISTDGNDKGSGSSQQPFATLQRAVNLATTLAMNYTNIVYKAGVYDGNQFADLSSTGCLNTLCLVTEDNPSNVPLVVFDGQGCSDVPILSLWNVRAANFKIGHLTRRFAFVNGGYGIQITGDHNKLQISNNSFSSQQESAIYLGGSLLIKPIVEGENAYSDPGVRDSALARRFDDNDDETSSDTEEVLSEESDRREFYVIIDHNDICSACSSQRSLVTNCQSIPSQPSYNSDYCSAIDTHEYDDELYFHYNLVRNSFGYGLRAPMLGMQVYKNIFTQSYIGHILSEYSRVEVNTNWIYDAGTLIPQETLQRDSVPFPCDSVFGIGLAPPFGVPMSAVTIGNNLINGVAHVLATFNTQRHLHPYQNDYCPDAVYVDFGYNTVLNIGGKSTGGRTVVSRTGATLIWPQFSEVRADFHSNIFHYHASTFEQSLLDNEDDVRFFCNQWMVLDDPYDTDDDTELDGDDFPNDMPFTDFEDGTPNAPMCSGVDYQGSLSDEDFFYTEFEEFEFYTGDDSIGGTLVPNFSPHNLISAWPINFMLNQTGDAAQALQGCSINVDGVNNCTGRHCCNNIYRYDFSGYRRNNYDRRWTKGFQGFCNDEDADERCPFYIFWSTPYVLVDVPQHEDYPAPDPLTACNSTTSSVTSNCMKITAPPPPRRNPCNGAQNFYIHPDGENAHGYGKSPEQPLRNLEGAIYEINRLIIEENLCSAEVNGTANTVNIIYMAGNHYDVQMGDFSLLRPIGNDICSTVNILADEGTYIWGSLHNESIFQIYNLDHSIDLWIGGYDAAKTSYQFGDTDDDYLYDACLAQDWGLNIGNGKMHGIWIGRTLSPEYISTDEESGERGLRKRTVVQNAKPVPDSVETEASKVLDQTVDDELEVVAEVALDAEIHIVSNTFNNLGLSAIYSEEPEPTTVQGNSFAFICQNKSPAPYLVVDPTGPDFCWAVNLVNGFPAVVKLNDFKNVVGSGVKCPFVDDEYARSQRQYRMSCTTQQNIFRDITYTPWVGYTSSNFIQNWVSCTTKYACAFGFFLDNKREDLYRVRVYSNLFNGVNHSFRHVQAHQISPDMDEIDPFEIDLRVMFNDFFNIQVSYGLFQEQAFDSLMLFFGNLFSYLDTPSEIDTEEGGLMETVAEFPNNVIYTCNAWFCGTSGSGPTGKCYLWPEVKYPPITCIVPFITTDTDNYYHQLLRDVGFTTNQFEPFVTYTDGVNNPVSTTTQSDVTNSTTWPVTYRICESYDPQTGNGPSETFLDTDGDFFDCIAAHRLVESSWQGFTDGVEILDFVNKPHTNTFGFWEIPDSDCTRDNPSYQFWWNTDPDSYDPDLAPYPPTFFNLTKWIAPARIVVTPTPVPSPIPSLTPTPAPNFSPTPYPSFTPTPSPSPTPTAVVYQRECPVSFCGSWVSVVAFCVNANDPNKECGNYFETNLWEDNFGTQCNCTGGCFPVSGCNNGTVGSYYGPYAFLTTLNVYSNNRTLAQVTANNIAKSALQGSIDGVKVITAVYYPPQQVISRKGVEFVDMLSSLTTEGSEKREVVESVTFDETGVVGTSDMSGRKEEKKSWLSKLLNSLW